MAKKHEVAVDAVYFTSPTDLCLHNDSVRALGGPLVSSASPDDAFAAMSISEWTAKLYSDEPGGPSCVSTVTFPRPSASLPRANHQRGIPCHSQDSFHGMDETKPP